MALDQSALLEVLEALKAAEVDDRIRSAATTIYQALIEAELTAVIGAAPHERTDARTAQRNGSRPRTLTTTAGDLELRIPKLRAGSFFPSLLERRGHGGLSARRLHPQARRPSAAAANSRPVRRHTVRRPRLRCSSGRPLSSSDPVFPAGDARWCIACRSGPSTTTKATDCCG